LGKAIDREYNLADLLRRPDVSYQALTSMDDAKYRNQELADALAGDEVSRETTRAVIEQIEIAAKYSGYIDRQRDEVERAAHYENLKLPEDLDYNAVTALSFEVRQRLSRQRPETLGQASRLSGVTPAAISLLLIHLKRSRVKGFVAVVADPSAEAA
jgi:tRNA uridine 5-carboxymethylaminomethyl modification enzyme